MVIVTAYIITGRKLSKIDNKGNSSGEAGTQRNGDNKGEKKKLGVVIELYYMKVRTVGQEFFEVN